MFSSKRATLKSFRGVSEEEEEEEGNDNVKDAMTESAYRKNIEKCTNITSKRQNECNPTIRNCLCE